MRGGGGGRPPLPPLPPLPLPLPLAVLLLPIVRGMTACRFEILQAVASRSPCRKASFAPTGAT